MEMHQMFFYVCHQRIVCFYCPYVILITILKSVLHCVFISEQETFEFSQTWLE